MPRLASFYWLLSACRGVLLLLALGVGIRPNAWAQGENNNWCFGAGVLVSFQNGTVTGMGQSSIRTSEAAAAMSDSQGNLLFYTDGVTIWDRTHAPMPNGTGLHGHTSARQGVLIVRQPGSSHLYYVFTTDAAEHLMMLDGLQYSQVDMSLRNGLGDVTAVKNVRLPAPLLTSTVDEGVIGVQHANRRDVWVLTHEYQGTGQVSAFLVTAAGVSATPVTSPFVQPNMTGGYFRISPDGEHLVMAPPRDPLRLYDFSASTGRVTNPRVIGVAPNVYAYGLAFSPDASKLYVSRTYSTIANLYQYDLLAGTNAAIQASEARVGPVSGLDAGATTSSLELGPDNQLYYSASGFTMGVVAQPNRPAAFCGYRAQALPLRNNAVNSDGGIQNIVQPLLGPQFTPPRACAGQVASFTTRVPSSDPGVVVSWDFGDPAAGVANTATSASATHVFANAGTYTVTLRVQWSGGGQSSSTGSVVISTRPTARFASRTIRLCTGSSALLQLNAQPAGTRYRWSDNSTDSTLLVRTSGRYWVDVTSAQGCTARDTALVDGLPRPLLTLRADTVLCPGQVVLLRSNAQPTGTVYRWGDGSHDATYQVSRPGTYRLQVTSAQGCTATDSLEVRLSDCPVVVPTVIIPNVITPNGDGQNEAFILRGLETAAWRLEVYNRWGVRVYSSVAYANEWRALGQPNGVYFYLLTHALTGQRYRGWVEVRRN